MENHTASINSVSSFLASPDLNIADVSSYDSIDAIVICASECLNQATVLFRTLEANPSLAKALVLCGGVGHSTSRIYDAVSRDPEYHVLATEIDGLPEARILGRIVDRFFDVQKIRGGGSKVLIEDQSTNCGANAANWIRVLDEAGVDVKTLVIVQDPTMARRTVASFQRIYERAGREVEVLSCPIFVPLVSTSHAKGQLEFCVPHVDGRALWDVPRFLHLIMGEIPRLKNNESEYSPRGKGFIVHVDIPVEVEEAWESLTHVVKGQRG